MIYFYRLALVVILNVLLISSYSTAMAGAQKDLVDKYIKLSGMDEAISNFPEQFDAILKQRSLVSGDIENETKIFNIMRDAFDVNTAQADMKKYLSEKYNDKSLNDLIEWYSTDLAQKIKIEESRAAKPEAQAEMLRYIADLQENPPAKERIAVIHEFEKATSLSELATSVSIDMLRGFIKTANESLPKKDRQSKDKIENEISKIRPAIQQKLRQQMIISLFYVYRNFSNDELGKYIDFYKTNLGKKELDTTSKALSFALNKWFTLTGEGLVNLSKNKSNI